MSTGHSSHHRRLATPATVVRAQLKGRWSSQQSSSLSEEPLPCCETYPLDTGTRENDTPEYIKRFLHQIEIVPESNDPEPSTLQHNRRGSLADRVRMSEPQTGRSSRRNSAAPDEIQEAVQPVHTKANHRFTEMEIVTLWNRFKFDFPTGNVNEKQLLQLFRQVFPRCNNHEAIVDNVLRVFDPDDSGIVSFRELLILFSMSMEGTPREKLHWAFRLYDQDGDDLLNEDDMVDVFHRLWKLAANMDAARTRGPRKRPVKPIEEPPEVPHPAPKPPPQQTKTYPKQKSKTKTKSGERKKMWKAPVVQPEPKMDIQILSSKMSSRNAGLNKGRKKVTKKAEPEVEALPPESEALVNEEPEVVEEPQINEEDKLDPTERALDIFHSLDVDRDGVVTEEEFVEGCLTDPNFLAVLENFNCDFIWNT